MCSALHEMRSSRRVLGKPPSYSVVPWPAIWGWTRNRSRRSDQAGPRQRRAGHFPEEPRRECRPSGSTLPRAGPGGVLVAAGHRRPVALHHFIGDPASQHGAAFIHQTCVELVRFVVGDSFAVIDAAVEDHIQAEGQKSHGVLLSTSGVTECPSAWKRTRAPRQNSAPDFQKSPSGTARSRPTLRRSSL